MKITSFLRVIVFLILINPSGLKSQVIAEAGKDTILCQEDSFFTLGGNPSASGGAGGYKYHWYSKNYDWVYNQEFINDTTSSNPVYYVGFGIVNITFYLTVTDKFGAKDTDSIVVKRNRWYSLDECGYDFTIKKGESVKLCIDYYSIFHPNFYHWSPTNSLSDSTTQSPYAKPDKTTMYTVRIIDSAGCKMYHTTMVNVLPNYIKQEIRPEIILISPNPFNNSCVININIPEISEISLEILDVNGKKIRTIKPQTNSYELRKGELSAGVFFILAKVNNEFHSVRKLVVQ